MSECPMKRSGRANHPEVHTWRIRYDIDDYEAYCIVDGCKAYSSPDVVNDLMDSMEEENEALGWMLHEHVTMLGDAEKWAEAWKAAAKNRYGRQRHIIKLLEGRIEQMLDHSSCIHCGKLIADDDPGAKDHWKECNEHPANKRIKELEDELEARDAISCKTCIHRFGYGCLKSDREAAHCATNGLKNWEPRKEA